MTTAQKLRIQKTLKETITLRDLYKIQVRKYGTKVSFEDYREIIIYTADKMIDSMIDGRVYELPGSLGTMLINEISCKMKSNEFGINRTATSYPIDPVATRASVKAGVKKLIYDLSFDSIFKFKWNKGIFKNKTVYYLATSSKFNSKLYHNAKRKLR